MTLVMSGQVFARVDSGRQYQLRPGLRSIWIRQIATMGMDVCVSQLPDTPDVRQLAAPAGVQIVPGPVQSTNSWGCRGAEPDMNALSAASFWATRSCKDTWSTTTRRRPSGFGKAFMPRSGPRSRS